MVKYALPQGVLLFISWLTILDVDLEQYKQKVSDGNAKTSHALLDVPFLADIVEEMLLPRYHLQGDESWSENALEFLSCCMSGSIETLLKVRSDTV